MKEITLEDIKNILRIEVRKSLLHIHHYEYGTNVYDEETRISMQIIMTAVEEYDRDQASKGAAVLTADIWVPPLVVAPKSRAILARLDRKAWNFEHKYELRDAWGAAIQFIPNGGPDGKHQLISAGPDGDMTTEEDNLRYRE